MKTYTPKPIDTSDVELTQDLLELADLLAENTHNIWARTRIDAGWSYAETRNDELKTTPCLVPYNELPDSEKTYDINTAYETIKVLIKLGYKISKE